MISLKDSTIREVVRGSVLLPGDEGFDGAGRPWNRAVEQDVLAVVAAADVDDVVALVRFARQHGLSIATQPTGHSPTTRTAGTILLRTGALTELSVDAERRAARFGAGVRSGQLLAAAAEHGLCYPVGSSPIVAATGYTLGGGVGWFARKYGIAAEHVLAFDVVDHEGVRRVASADENADLFWALRGGGGDFAIVVATEVALAAEPEVFGGGITWPQTEAAAVLEAFREVTATAPEELTVWVTLLDVPGGGPKLVVVHAVFLGPEEEGRRLLKPFTAVGGAVADTLAAFPMADLGAVTSDPTDPSPSNGRSELLSRFGAEEAAVLLAEPLGPLTFVQVRHLGGALTRGQHGPHGALDEPYAVGFFGIPVSPEADAGIVAKQEALTTALGDAVTGRKPFTFLGRSETAAAAFRPADLARLREVKAAWDPTGVFRANYPVQD